MERALPTYYQWLHFTILRSRGAVTRGKRGRGSNRGKGLGGAGRGGRRAPHKQRMCEDCEENAATQYCADCQPPLVLCDNCALVLHRGVTRRNHQLKGKVPLRSFNLSSWMLRLIRSDAMKIYVANQKGSTIGCILKWWHIVRAVLKTKQIKDCSCFISNWKNSPTLNIHFFWHLDII